MEDVKQAKINGKSKTGNNLFSSSTGACLQPIFRKLSAFCYLLSTLFMLSCPGLCAPAKLPPMEGDEIFLSAADGWKLYGRYQRPSGSRAVLVLLHSRGRSSLDWRLFAYALKQWGLGYLAFDFRGHGFSITEPGGSTTTYKNFRKTGMDNEFNKMTRDAEAAVQYLSEQGIPENNVILAGSELGANIAVKVAAIHPSISRVILLSPSLNADRDVLTVNPMRAYGKRPILLAVSEQNARSFKEFMLLNDIAQRTAGNSRVTMLTAEKGIGTKLLNKRLIRRIFEWLKNPQKPPETESPPSASSSLLPSFPPSSSPSSEEEKEEPRYKIYLQPEDDKASDKKEDKKEEKKKKKKEKEKREAKDEDKDEDKKRAEPKFKDADIIENIEDSGGFEDD